MSRNDEYILVNVEDAISILKDCLVAAGGSKDDAVLYEQCKSAGPKPSDFIRRQFADMQRLRNALGDIVALVRGECPSLLNEDSGGNAVLSIEIESLLESKRRSP
jgi:hypothetical protein